MSITGKKLLFDFSEGSAEMKAILGGKGANLAQMMRIGLPVPPGFTLTTETCLMYMEKPSETMDAVWPDVRRAMAALEEKTGKTFGGPGTPLLVSVRSGAPVSMPGMMDTILNLGLNDETTAALAVTSGDRRFALDSYRRFIQMFSDVVLGVSSEEFENVLTATRRKLSVQFDNEIPPEELEDVVAQFKKIVRKATGHEFPADPWLQLKAATEAVFHSWNTPRAVTYRKINSIPDNLGTAVNIVAMVFGNLGEDCGTGVCFTRNPSTGEKGLFGEFLINAQGEDVVAGIRTPEPIQKMGEKMPALYRELLDTAEILEKHYKDMQDIEFTVERGKLYMLQTRNGKRTAKAAVQVAVDMVNEGLIDRTTAVSRVSPEQVERLLHRQIDPSLKLDVLAKGLPASPGAAVGQLVFDADEAERMGHDGKPVILVRPETTPDDIHGLFAAQGVLTSRGGMTSHAAVVARGLGKPCVSGCEALHIDLAAQVFSVESRNFRKGDWITIDGSRGLVIPGKVDLVQPSFADDIRTLLDWADEFSALEVWANADTPEDATRARAFGARGIGLCRTEHMFMAAERLPVMQEMIISSTREERLLPLEKLQRMQREDFEGIFEAMAGFPVTIRLLDPPLHEFLPKEHEIKKDLESLAAQGKEKSPEAEALKLKLAKASSLHENNPMLGFRGCRLGIVYPEIYEMQLRAIFQAACALTGKGVKVIPDIMMPLVGTREEMIHLKEMTERIAEEQMTFFGCRIHYLVGTMIEVPRAALVADQLAESAEFFSFGTNDLSQTTFGYSRDDAEGKFLAEYVRQGILPANPFHTLDREGVGQLMSIAVEKSRPVRPAIQIGICGEHGGEPTSIAFCHTLGLRYVSCSPFRVPVARLAAAHSAIGLIR
ncbi:MAG: pyruvate, phosphate dikinase [Synergistales bacterium]